MVVEIIAKYLESNKRLIIPNLGAFMVKVPGQTILFSNLLKNDDGVLRSLVAAQGMSEIEAAGVVDRFVFEINYRLQNNGECKLGGFGRLIQAANSAISFEFAPATEGDALEGDVKPKSQSEPKNQVEQPAKVEKEVAQPEPQPIEDDGDEQSVEIEVMPRKSEPRREPQRRISRVEVVYDDQRVSASSRMRPDDYVKGLRYGKGRKIVSGRESAMTRRSNKSDLIMKIAIAAALIAMAALGYGMWNDWRASRLDAEIYGEVPESAESAVRNPDLDYIEQKAQ